MSIEGRELERLIRRAVAALESTAESNKKLLELANEEQITVEPGPPICPNCGKLNPVVTQLNTGGDGPLNEFVMAAETHCCNHRIYCVPDGFSTFLEYVLAEDYVRGKGGKNANAT